MHRVFAVLFLVFLLLQLSCNSISSTPEKALPISSTFRSSAIYTSSGDFDGDGKMESIFITKPDECYHMSIIDKEHIINKKLNYRADNLKLTIQDINNDNREEIIINIIQNNCENCYVYTVTTDIITLLSPDIIIGELDRNKIDDYIALECGYMALTLENSRERDIKLYYTEMDYSEDGSIFISEGSVFDKNITLLNIQATICIDKNGMVILKNINMLPAKN